MSILGQKSCIWGLTFFKIPQPNWHLLKVPDPGFYSILMKVFEFISKDNMKLKIGHMLVKDVTQNLQVFMGWNYIWNHSMLGNQSLLTKPAGLVLEFEISVHQKSTTNNLSKSQFKKINKKWKNGFIFFFLRLEIDFFWL